MTKELEELRKLAGLPVVEDCDEEVVEEASGQRTSTLRRIVGPGETSSERGRTFLSFGKDQKHLATVIDKLTAMYGEPQVKNKALVFNDGEKDLMLHNYDRFNELSFNYMDESDMFKEDCDESEDDKNDDGECSPFTHADDNVAMVREDDFEEDYLVPPKDLEDGHYEDDDDGHWDNSGNVSVRTSEPFDNDRVVDNDDEGTYSGKTNFDDETFDDWTAKYPDESVEEADSDDPSAIECPGCSEIAFNKIGKVGKDDEFECENCGKYGIMGALDEQGPGDDEDEFAADDDAMVDVGDDEDYEEFDFNDEFEQMMGNTNRFEAIEINELRKRAGLAEKTIVTKDDIAAAGGEVVGHKDEVTGGPGTSTRHDGSDQVRISVAKGFPNMKQWWKEDPKDIMSMVYWQKNQLPPSDEEAFARNWEKVKANLTKKFGAAPEVAESTDNKDDYDFFNFDDEKAYYLVADEIGDQIIFGMQNEVGVPEQYTDKIVALLTDHGFEQGRAYEFAGMEEDLQNGYNDRESVDDEFDLRFPAGATSSPARELGPAGAKHGDNPMRTPMASVDKDEDYIYESFKHAYRRFRK